MSEYEQFFDWLDEATGDIVTPALGDVPSYTFKASDMVAFCSLSVASHEGQHLADALFDEYIKLKFKPFKDEIDS